MMPIPPLSIDEICEYLDIGRDDFYKWIMMKELPAYYLAPFQEPANDGAGFIRHQASGSAKPDGGLLWRR